MIKKIMAGVLTLACFLAFAGCAEKVELAGIALADSPITLAPGQSAQVEISPSFSKDAPTEDEIAEVLTTVTLVWTSSDEAVATVQDGAVTAHAPGAATITVGDAEGRYSATVVVTVVQPVESATAPDALTLDLLAGTPANLDVNVLPANATGVVIAYSSNDESIVTVAADGTLTPIAEGEAVITTTVAGDGLEGRTEQTLTTKVTVALLPQGIGLDAAEGVLYVGYSHQLKPYSLPAEAPESSYTFESSDAAVATVDETGTIKAVAVGTATITITSAEGHTASYAVTVTKAPASGGGNGGGSGGSGGAGGSGGSGGGASGDGGAPAGGGDGGGGGSTPPNIGDGTAENPYENEYVDVGEDDLKGIDGLG